MRLLSFPAVKLSSPDPLHSTPSATCLPPPAAAGLCEVELLLEATSGRKEISCRSRLSSKAAGWSLPYSARSAPCPSFLHTGSFHTNHINSSALRPAQDFFFFSLVATGKSFHFSLVFLVRESLHWFVWES